MSIFSVGNTLEPVILFYFGTSKGFLGGGVLLVSIGRSWTTRACVLAQVSMGPTIVPVGYSCVEHQGVCNVDNLLCSIRCVGMRSVVNSILDLSDKKFEWLVGIPGCCHPIIVVDEIGR